jgi:NAD(P)-dependent dehydrogenase (short-subunit alcohol dehydrogenase family)
MKIALITGAGSGIGRVTARALLENDYAVVLAGRKKHTLEETARGYENTLVVPTDVTDPQSVKNLFAQTEANFGRLDLLFNNAGVNIPAIPLEEVSPEQWKMVLETNVSGVFFCIQEAFKLMKKQTPAGGRIINNGSISAHVPRPFSSPYTASKHAITGLTKAAGLDGRQFDIAVGQIDIGNAASEMTQKMTTGVPQADGRIAIEPTMPAEHVAQAVLYMDSLPLSANVPFLTVMANQMPYWGRG